MKKRKTWTDILREQRERVDEQILWQKKIIREESREVKK